MQHESTFLLASDSGGIEVDRNRLLLSEYFVTQCKEYLIKYNQMYTARIDDVHPDKRSEDGVLIN